MTIKIQTPAPFSLAIERLKRDGRVSKADYSKGSEAIEVELIDMDWDEDELDQFLYNHDAILVL